MKALRTVIAPSGEQVEIAAGEHRAVVVEVGGGLRSYSVGGREVLDGYGLDEMAGAGRGQVLVPWPNRLEDGVYDFDGESYQLPLNELAARNAIHGLVRWSAWTVGARDADRVVMERILAPQPGYPFPVGLTIEYSVGRTGLRVRTTATNVGPEPCPFGAGAHPYLWPEGEGVDEAVVALPARTVFELDSRGLPVGRKPVQGTELDFRHPRPLGATVLDHAFTDLDRDGDGIARFDIDGTTLWMDSGYGYAMVFTGDPLPSVARRSLAIEPMTCPPNAFRTGEGLIRLEPGESFTGEWGIAPG